MLGGLLLAGAGPGEGHGRHHVDGRGDRRDEADDLEVLEAYRRGAERFSADRVVSLYEDFYRRVLAR